MMSAASASADEAKVKAVAGAEAEAACCSLAKRLFYASHPPAYTCTLTHTHATQWNANNNNNNNDINLIDWPPNDGRNGVKLIGHCAGDAARCLGFAAETEAEARAATVGA